MVSIKKYGNLKNSTSKLPKKTFGHSTESEVLLSNGKSIFLENYFFENFFSSERIFSFLILSSSKT